MVYCQCSVNGIDFLTCQAQLADAAGAIRQQGRLFAVFDNWFPKPSHELRNRRPSRSN